MHYYFVGHGHMPRMPLRRARGSRQGQDQGRGLNSQASCVPRIRRAGGQHTLELAMLISLTSLGSNQTLRLPHLSTLAASRFCSNSDTPILATSHVLERAVSSYRAYGGGGK